MDNNSYQEQLNAFWAQEHDEEEEETMADAVRASIFELLNAYAALLSDLAVAQIKDRSQSNSFDPIRWCLEHKKIRQYRPQGVNPMRKDAWEMYAQWYEEQVETFLIPATEQLEEINQEPPAMLAMIARDLGGRIRCARFTLSAFLERPGQGRPSVKGEQIDLLFEIRKETIRNPEYKNKTHSWIKDHVCRIAAEIWETAHPKLKKTGNKAWENRYSEMMKKKLS